MEQSGQRQQDRPNQGGRGFASMDSERQRVIASKGGQSVPDEKRSFSRNPGLASQAGRKGGQSVPNEKRSFSQNHSLAAEAGRKGGQQSHGGGARAGSADAAKDRHRASEQGREGDQL